MLEALLYLVFQVQSWIVRGISCSKPSVPCISCSKPICSLYFMLKSHLYFLFHVQMQSVPCISWSNPWLHCISCLKPICTLYFMFKGQLYLVFYVQSTRYRILLISWNSKPIWYLVFHEITSLSDGLVISWNSKYPSVPCISWNTKFRWDFNMKYKEPIGLEHEIHSTDGFDQEIPSVQLVFENEILSPYRSASISCSKPIRYQMVFEHVQSPGTVWACDFMFKAQVL